MSIFSVSIVSFKNISKSLRNSFIKFTIDPRVWNKDLKTIRFLGRERRAAARVLFLRAWSTTIPCLVAGGGGTIWKGGVEVFCPIFKKGKSKQNVIMKSF